MNNLFKLFINYRGSSKLYFKYESGDRYGLFWIDISPKVVQSNPKIDPDLSKMIQK